MLKTREFGDREVSVERAGWVGGPLRVLIGAGAVSGQDTGTGHAHEGERELGGLQRTEPGASGASGGVLAGEQIGKQIGEAPHGEPEERADEAGSKLEGAIAQHLLVVDDDDAVRSACCEIARRMGFHVHEADSVPSARAILKRLPADVLLLDMKLPGGGGLLLLEETKALHPETAVVVMTAFATVSSAVEAMRIGAADYLTKPFALEELKSDALPRLRAAALRPREPDAA